MTTRAARLDWRARHGPVHATVNIALGLIAAATVTSHLPFGGWEVTIAAIGQGTAALLTWLTVLIGVAIKKGRWKYAEETGRAVIWGALMIGGATWAVLAQVDPAASLVVLGMITVAVFTSFAMIVTGHSQVRAVGTGLLIIAGGAWVLVARVDPLNVPVLAVLVVAAICAGIMAVLVRRRVDGTAAAEAARKLLEATRTASGRLAEEWRARLARVCRVEGRVRSMQKWPTGTGFTLVFQPDEGGTTAADIAAHASRLAADARLPIGCGVEVGTGDHRGEVLLKVATVNAMATEKPFPLALPMRSINESLPVGVRRDGTESTIRLRFASLALAGQKGSGKTNRLHVLTAQLASCVDVLTWHIDLTGGLSLPWVQPWLEGRAAVPGVDWVATTPEEAKLMVDAALAIVRGRKPAYRKLMRRANDDKLPISPAVPQVVIVVDEFASLPRDVQGLLIKVSDEGRGPGVQTVCCALRGTVDYLPKELLVQAANRISMRGSSESEHAFVMGWAARLDPDEVPYEGCGFVKSAENFLDTPVPDRAYRIVPSMVDDVVVATASRRPQLDEVSVKMAETVAVGAYTRRWDRLAEADAILEAGRARTEATLAPVRERAAARAEFEAARAQRPAGGVDLADPRTWPTARTTAYQRSPAQELMLEALKAAVPNGLQPAQLHARLVEAGHGTTRQTVQDWLALEMSRGLVRQPVDRGPYYLVQEQAAA